MSQLNKGSSHQILQLVLRDPGFITKRVNDLLRSDDICFSSSDHCSPNSQNYKESTIEEFLPDCNMDFPQFENKSIQSWWAAVKQKPNWDFISTCKINGRKGILLVETKSHFGELEAGGKKILVDLNVSGNKLGEIIYLMEENHYAKNLKLKLTINELTTFMRLLLNNSLLDEKMLVSLLTKLRNHDTIGNAISEANGALSQYVNEIHISRDNHYQLSNRIAYTWKLAKSGIPVILLYLGFLNDPAWFAKKDYFESKEQWVGQIQRYFSEVGAKCLVDMQKITLANGIPMFFCVDAVEATNLE